jgi:hypothetical protein
MSRPPTLLWVPKGLNPLSSLFERGPAEAAGLSLHIFNNISDAVDAAIEQRSQKDTEGFLPHICFGVGEGPAVFNVQGILALKMALAEGATNHIDN